MLYDKAMENWNEYKEELEEMQNKLLSEADTRVKIIDMLFSTVLGWDEENITREDKIEAGYIDYIYRSDNNYFLVEAKRSGSYFELPRTRSKLVKSHNLKGKNIAEAIHQADKYCSEIKCPVFIVSNGLQLAIIKLDQRKRKHLDTLLFNGKNDIDRNFHVLFNVLSPESSALEELESLFIDNSSIRQVPQFSKTLLQNVYHPDEAISKNPVDSILRPYISQYFGDITREDKPELLKKCYCDTEKVAQYEKQLELYLRDRIPKLDVPVVPVKTQKDDAGEFQEEYERILSQSTKEIGAVFLLVGGIGVGKTTFIHRFFNYILDKPTKEYLIWLYIDFRETTENTANDEWVINSLLEQLREKYEDLNLENWETLLEVYEKEISRYTKGPWKPLYEYSQEKYELKVSEFISKQMENKQEHLKYLLNYCNNKGYGVCIIFDNTDQFSQELQEWAFTLSYQKAKEYNAISLLALREETFWLLKNTKPMDAYPSVVYHITAPRVLNVISKRLQLLKEEVENERVTIRSTHHGKEFTCEANKLIQVLIDSFLGEDGSNVRLLECLANNNIRNALNNFDTIITSGHTLMDQHINRYITGKPYTIPYYVAVRGLALGDRKYYKSSRSKIMNMFTTEDDGFYSHFSKIRILRYLEYKRNLGGQTGYGFVEIDEVYNYFASCFSSLKNFCLNLYPLLNFALIETDDGKMIYPHNPHQYLKLTIAGHYYLNILLKQFDYLEHICIDTPIQSREYYEKLSSIFNETQQGYAPLKKRLNLVLTFLEYLYEKEEEEYLYLDNEVFSPIIKELIDCIKKQEEKLKK